MLRKMPKSNPSKTIEEDEDDTVIDFSNAQLYVGGIQVITATTLVAISSVACCLTTSLATVSAVRTLVVSSTVGVVVVQKPFRIGKVHGLILVFRALQPCVAIYVFSMIVEQLTHACATSSVAPHWRSVVFNLCTVAMIVSGFIVVFSVCVLRGAARAVQRRNPRVRDEGLGGLDLGSRGARVLAAVGAGARGFRYLGAGVF